MYKEPSVRLSTGIPGLDEVLCGGLLAHHTYLVRGRPGTGKTTLGLHFLTAGAVSGERTLLISIAESEPQMRRNAQALGFDLRDTTILDLSPTANAFAEMKIYDVFTPADAERTPTTRKIIQQVESLKPKRIFVDALTQFRYLSPDPFQFRKQLLGFGAFLVEQGATVVFTSEVSATIPDDDVQFMSDGVISLDFSTKLRTLRVTKFRGSDFQSGDHTLRLTGRGMEIFPRLLPEAHGREVPFETIPSGLSKLDQILHGGLERGTVSMICGPTGVGKTTVALQFLTEAARRGGRSVVYLFEESAETLLRRCESLKTPAREMIECGSLSVVQVEPLRLSADEFASMVRREVEERNARIVMLDSVSGYQLSLHGEDLVLHLHSLNKYLKNMGVTAILVSDVEAITGDFRVSDIGISYLTDNIVFLRYIEIGGELRRAIGVLKKRLGSYEKPLREIEITSEGIEIGKPLKGLRGLLCGVPVLTEPAERGE